MPGTDDFDSVGTAQAQGFGFTVSNGGVTAMQRVSGTHTRDIKIPDDATFTVASGSVTETIAGSAVTEVIQYTADPTNSSLYHISSETTTLANPTTTSPNGAVHGFSLTIANNTVTGVQFVEGNGTHTHSFDVPLPPLTTFTVNGSTVSATLVHDNEVETVKLVQPAGSTLYAIASDSTTIIQPGSATTLLSVRPFDRAQFTIDASGTVTGAQHVFPNGMETSINANSHVAFAQVAPGFVEQTVTFGARSGFALYYDANRDGTYTEVAHGAGTTIDLVGLQAQLAELPAAATALL